MRCESLKNQTTKLMVFFTLSIVVCSFCVLMVKGQPVYDAWFTHIYVTNGNSEIDLIDGGTAKVYREQEAVMKLTVYNNKDSSTYLYINIYRNDERIVKDSGFSVEPRSSSTEEFSASAWGPATDSYKVELFYYYWFTPYVIDVKEFEIKVVKLEVFNWASSTLSVQTWIETGSLTVTFANGGNDLMHDTNISVLDSAGLTVTPQTQSLGNINEAEAKSATFSVHASRGTTPKTYQITFEVAYNDLRGVTHTENFKADVTVTLDVISEHMNTILIVSIFTAIALVIAIPFLRLRKRKQIQTK